jgi:hypothetical protein
VKRYDGTTGAFLGAFVSPSDDGLSPGSSGLRRPFDLLFGPDGNLYVSDVGAVKRYDGVSGAFLGDFVPPRSGGLSTPGGLTFTPPGPAVEVLVDVKPGSMVNPIKLSSSGVVPAPSLRRIRSMQRHSGQARFVSEMMTTQASAIAAKRIAGVTLRTWMGTGGLISSCTST